MSKQPFFSVIVPCYNQDQYLEEAINSVIIQTFTNWECLIINDGSPDNTEDIALTLCKRDDRIKYYKKENTGVADTRNYGIQKSSGTWILPLDGDDKISDKYLERAYHVIQTNSDVDVIYSKAQFFGECQGIWDLPKYDYKRLLISNIIYCSAFFKKIDFISIGGYDIDMLYGYEDWEFWINLLKNNTENIIQLDTIDFFYRRKSSSRDKDLLENHQRTLEMKNIVFEKHKDIYYKYFGSFQDNLYDLHIKNEYIHKLNVKLHKNILTRFLFKIILAINKIVLSK